MKNNRISRTGEPLIRTIEDWPKRLFAIGDIHGCHAELSALIQHLKAPEQLSRDDLLIFMGDYIDRGPCSKQVIELLLELQREYPKTVFLKGNHEDMLLSFLGLGGKGGEVYLGNGGAEFFQSYGVAPFGPLSAIASALPEAHLEFLQRLDTGVALAEFIFVHAGLNPEEPLERQTAGDLLWIRSTFTRHPHSFGKTVVFGHTPYEKLLLDLPFKIGIDTGLVYGNRLSCVELVEGHLFQVDAGSTEVIQSALSAVS